MACARTLQYELEKLEPHARENFARVNACEVSALFTCFLDSTNFAHFVVPVDPLFSHVAFSTQLDSSTFMS